MRKMYWAEKPVNTPIFTGFLANTFVKFLIGNVFLNMCIGGFAKCGGMDEGLSLP